MIPSAIWEILLTSQILQLISGAFWQVNTKILEKRKIYVNIAQGNV